MSLVFQILGQHFYGCQSANDYRRSRKCSDLSANCLALITFETRLIKQPRVHNSLIQTQMRRQIFSHLASQFFGWQRNWKIEMGWQSTSFFTWATWKRFNYANLGEPCWLENPQEEYDEPLTRLCSAP